MELAADEERNHPGFLFVDDEQSVCVSDSDTHQAMKCWQGATAGVIFTGGKRQGKRRDELAYPEGVHVDRRGHVYVADWFNDRVVCWREDDRKGETITGGNGQGRPSNQWKRPNGLSFDEEGNLYAAEWENSRIQKLDVAVEQICFVELKTNVDC
jgi:tripartite motif-containing protein 71